MRVPVCDVNSDNFTQLWPSLLLAVRSASFVALDTELSGLGDRRALNAKSIDDRYKAMCHISQTRSIVSLGLSTFKFLPPAEKIVDVKGGNSEVGSNWMVQTFNITVLCREEYVVEPEALVFLVDHGFDFNKQYSRGIPYSKGGNQDPSKPDKASIANLLSQLIIHRVPVVFHNAFVDLGFLYGNLYGPLPSSLGVFLSDLSEMFQGGVFDTKYITEFVARYPASFLDYVFHRSLRGNAAEPCDCRVALTFPTYPDGCDFIGYRECSVSPRPALHAEVLQAMRGLVCSTFASYGWCPKRRQCPKSHDIDLILDTEEEEVKKKSRNRKRKRQRGNAGTCNPVDRGQTEERDNPDMDTAKDLHENTNSTCRVMKADEIHSDDNLTLKNDSEVSTKPSENEIISIHSSNQCSSKSPRGLNYCQEASDKTSHDSVVCTDTSTSVNKISKEPDAESSHMLTGETGDEKLDDSGSSKTNGSQSSHLSNSKGHRAGFDAFMTGFSMAAFAGRFGTKPLKGPGLNDWGIEQLVNKVYLTGKDIPLLITKPNFSKNSKHHIEKQKQLKALQTSETT